MKLKEVQVKKLQKLGIALVYLFGSCAEGKSLSFSDIDIGITFSSKSVLNNNLNQIYNQIYDIFTDVFPGKKVDIVFLQKAPLELRFDVVRHGKIIYASSSNTRFDFEEKTMLFYADFKPLLEEFNQTILDRF